MKEVICNNCGEPADLIDGLELYRMQRLKHKNFWRCYPCDSHVGCHDGTTKPLGTLADKETRDMRHDAHVCFDPLWKSAKNKGKKRKDLYKDLSTHMGLSKEECHIGNFTPKQCIEVIDWACKIKQKGNNE